jgi:hypothetical protein
MSGRCPYILKVLHHPIVGCFRDRERQILVEGASIPHVRFRPIWAGIETRIEVEMI